MSKHQIALSKRGFCAHMVEFPSWVILHISAFLQNMGYSAFLEYLQKN